MNFALIGPPGSGKASLALRLSARFSLERLSPDAVLSEAIARGTALGLLARRHLQLSEPVPDELLEGMLEERLRELTLEQALLFEAFPRSRGQAAFLDELLLALGRPLDAVLGLTLSEEVVLQRLPGRLVCRACRAPFHERLLPFESCPEGRCQGEHLYRRDDDQTQLVAARLAAFRRSSAPVLERYLAAGKLVLIDAAGPLPAIEEEAARVIESFREHRPAPLAAIDALQRPRAPRPLGRGEAAHGSVDLAFLGGPGSGKGTQAERLAQELGLPRISSGDLFRDNLRRETEVGRLARTYMDRGELVPDEVTERMVRERLSQPDAKAGFVLDGFPRTRPQAEGLTEMLNDRERRLLAVIHLRVPDEQIVERVSGRLVCSECQRPFHAESSPFVTCPERRCTGEYLARRDDDAPATVRARLRTYHAETAPLVEYYRASDLLVEVDGMGEVDEIQARVREEVSRRRGG